MRLLFLCLAAAALQAQMPVFGPDNPDGLVLWPNKSGRYAWLRKGSWIRQPLATQTFRGPFLAVTAAELAAIRATLDKLGDLF